MSTRARDAGEALAAVGSTSLAALGLMAEGGAAAALPGAVAGLLGIAAGSSAVPVVGWVIAGLAGVAAGSIALVHAIRQGQRTKAQARTDALHLGLQSPDDIAGYVVRVLGKTPRWRADETKKLVAKIKRNPDRTGTARRKDVERLQFLAIVDVAQQGATQGRLPPTAPIRTIEAQIPAESDPSTFLLAGGLAVAIGLALYF